eukprot:TRINITY_DN13785_c0_g1_i1.p1 TRINITY_DN13785_c0_g1~~TRINITY_DN13785_c0_g1_i1.p1  ORF type:complete len:441 (+),score=78.73 TRINITY_DN13785_c0_g1_i1:151-1323(+)
MVGAFILCFFGLGAGMASVLAGAHVGLWQVTVVWGWGVTIAIYCTAGISGAHLNPAVSLAFALLRPKDFSPRWLGPYALAQFVGSMLAALSLWGCYYHVLDDFLRRKGLTAGGPGSELGASVFGEYFPNPGFKANGMVPHDAIAPQGAMLVEMLGTAMLTLVVFAVTNPRNESGPQFTAPLIIGFTVASICAVVAPLTQSCLNPARDWGPRVVALMAGFKDVAFPGPRKEVWVYLMGPMIGGPLGGLVHDLLLRDSFQAGDDEADSEGAPAAEAEELPTGIASVQSFAERPLLPHATPSLAGTGVVRRISSLKGDAGHADGHGHAPVGLAVRSAPVSCSAAVSEDSALLLAAAVVELLSRHPISDPAAVQEQLQALATTRAQQRRESGSK